MKVNEDWRQEKLKTGGSIRVINGKIFARIQYLDEITGKRKEKLRLAPNRTKAREFIKHMRRELHGAIALGPQQSNQIDAGNNFFLFARPMPVNQLVSFRIRLFKRRIVENQNSLIEIDLRARFRSKRFGIRFKPGQKSGKSIMRRRILALGLNTLGFGRGDDTRRRNNNVDVILGTTFCRIHSLFLSNIFSTA